MDGLEIGHERRERPSCEQPAQLGADLGLPGDPDRAVLQQVEDPERRRGLDAPLDLRAQPLESQGAQVPDRPRDGRVEVSCKPRPARAGGGEHRERLLGPVSEHVLVRQPVDFRIARLAHTRRVRKVIGERVRERDLVRERALDVDPFDGVRVLAEALERDHDVLVHLERVGVACDGRGARAVAPECLARLVASRYEALAGTRIRDPDDLGCRAGDRRLVVARHVAQEHHLRQCSTARLRRVADGLEVSLVEVLEAGEAHAGGRLRADVIADLDDGGDGVACLAEELEADRADVTGHPVQHPARAGDDPIAAFFLHAGQAAEELVGDVLAESRLAEPAALDHETRAAQYACPVRRLAAILPREVEGRRGRLVDAAEVVAHARDFEPVALRVDHPPPGEVVDRRAPQHRFLAAGIHGDVAADAGGVGRGRVDRKCESGAARRLLDAARDDAGLREHGRHRPRDARQVHGLHGPDEFQLLGVDHGGERRQRHRATRVSGAAAAGNDGQSQLDAGAHESRDFVLGIGCEHDEGDLDPPVGGIGRVGDAGVRVEADVVGVGVASQEPLRPPTQGFHGLEGAGESGDRGTGCSQQPYHTRVAGLVRPVAPPLDVGEPMLQRRDQLATASRVVQQVLLEVRVAVHDPDVAQDLVEHAGRAARAPLRPQLVEQAPALGAQHPDDDLAVRERRVVVGDLAQACRRIERGRAGCGRRGGGLCVHVGRVVLVRRRIVPWTGRRWYCGKAQGCAAAPRVPPSR